MLQFLNTVVKSCDCFPYRDVIIYDVIIDPTIKSAVPRKVQPKWTDLVCIICKVATLASRTSFQVFRIFEHLFWMKLQLVQKLL